MKSALLNWGCICDLPEAGSNANVCLFLVGKVEVTQKHPGFSQTLQNRGEDRAEWTSSTSSPRAVSRGSLTFRTLRSSLIPNPQVLCLHSCEDQRAGRDLLTTLPWLGWKDFSLTCSAVEKGEWVQWIQGSLWLLGVTYPNHCLFQMRNPRPNRTVWHDPSDWSAPDRCSEDPTLLSPSMPSFPLEPPSVAGCRSLRLPMSQK